MNGDALNQKVNVKVLFFGAARDVVQLSAVEVTLPSSLRASDAFEQILETYPGLRRFGKSLLFAVNQEYAPENHLIREGDELAVFPPVSGGSGEERSTNGASQALMNERVNSKYPRDFFELIAEPLDVGEIARRVVPRECGATVTLDGYAREWTRGRKTLYLEYEAYQTMAPVEMRRIAESAHERFEIAHVGIVHRIGRVNIGETSVVISVSAPHRHAAFAACEWLIRELKRSVPIWKKEIFEDGSAWVEGNEGE